MGSKNTSINQSSTFYSATQNTTNPTIQDSDNAVVNAGNGNLNNEALALVRGSLNNSTINMTDGGSVAEAFTFASKVQESVSTANAAALNLVKELSKEVLDVGNKDAVAEERTNQTLWVFGGLVAFYFVVKLYGK